MSPVHNMHTSQYNTLHVTSQRTILHYTTSQTKHRASQHSREHQRISQISTSHRSIAQHNTAHHTTSHVTSTQNAHITIQHPPCDISANLSTQYHIADKTACITAHPRTSKHITDKHIMAHHTTSHVTSTQYANITIQHPPCDISANLCTQYHNADKTPSITAHIIILKHIADKHIIAHHTTSHVTSTQYAHITVQHPLCHISANLPIQYHIAD